MTDVMTKYYDVIKRTSGALYQMFDGEKITHTELLEEADRILPKTPQKRRQARPPRDIRRRTRQLGDTKHTRPLPSLA